MRHDSHTRRGTRGRIPAWIACAGLIWTIGCKSPSTATEPQYAERTGDPPFRAEPRGDVTEISKATFNATYVITRATPEYSSWANTEYSKWHVAFKDENHSDNVYYDQKTIDVRAITSTSDFMALNNDGRARNRFIRDSVYDDASYTSNDTEYCLRAKLTKVDYLRSTGETGRHEWYMRHWAFIAPQGKGNKGSVEVLGDIPSENSPFHSAHDPGTSGSDNVMRLDLAYNHLAMAGLCVKQGERVGVVSQLVENDTGGRSHPLSELDEMIEFFAEQGDNAHSVDAALFFFAEFVAYMVRWGTAAKFDDELYPVSLSFTWGALKRMHEANVNVSELEIRVYGVPENPDRIRVTDMWGGGSCHSGTYHPPGGATTTYYQHCLPDRPGERSAPSLAGEHFEDFYLPSNRDQRSGDLHFALGVAVNRPSEGCDLVVDDVTWSCPTLVDVPLFAQCSSYTDWWGIPALAKRYNLVERGWPTDKMYMASSFGPTDAVVQDLEGSNWTLVSSSSPPPVYVSCKSITSK